MLRITRSTAIRSVEAAMLHVRFATFYPCTTGKHVETHSRFAVSHNTFRHLSPLFNAVSAGLMCMRIVAFLFRLFGEYGSEELRYY
jgi:hypothetical protein